MLQRSIEQELVASGDITGERRARLTAILRGSEVPINLTQANGTKKRSRFKEDEDNEWMSTDAAAQLLNLSLAHVKALSQDGKLGHVDRDASGETMLERTAVLLYYRQRTQS